MNNSDIDDALNFFNGYEIPSISLALLLAIAKKDQLEKLKEHTFQSHYAYSIL